MSNELLTFLDLVRSKENRYLILSYLYLVLILIYAFNLFQAWHVFISPAVNLMYVCTVELRTEYTN